MDNKKDDRVNNVIKNSLLLQLVKLAVAFVLAWILVTAIACSFLPAVADGPDATIDEKWDLPITCIALALTIIVNVIVDFNAAQRLKSAVDKSRVDLASTNEIMDSLIDKAERITDKYRESEVAVYGEFAQARKSFPAVRNSSDFKVVLETYPELASNIHTQKLLHQLESAEQMKLNARTELTRQIAKYNNRIHSFPLSVFRRLFKLNDIQFSEDLRKEELVSDEELGI